MTVTSSGWRAAVAVVCAAGACGGTEPTPDPGPGPPAVVTILERPPASDTVAAQPNTPLRLRVTDAAGHPVPGVAFSVRVLDDASGGVAMFIDHPLAVARREVATATDSLGTAAVSLQYGPIAGQGKVVVSVDPVGRRDTLTFTHLPGDPVQLLLAPRDTIVYLGQTATLRTEVRDRFGNLRSGDPVTLTARPSTVTINGVSVRGDQFGEVEILGRVGVASDLVTVGAVPGGTLAAWHERSKQIVVFALDGSGRRDLAPADIAVAPGGFGLAWTPAGDRLIASVAAPVSHRLIEVSLQGNVRPITPVPGPALLNALWPSVSGDGAWIFFTGEPSLGQFDVWRVHLDGTGLESLGYTSGFDLGYAPSVSPDGARVAFVTSLFEPSKVRGRVIATGAPTGLYLDGAFPSWSPNGSAIALIEPPHRLLRLVGPDGSNARTLVSTHGYADGPPAWSPDERYLAVRAGRYIEIVEIATGRIVALRHAEEMLGPAWRPTP